MKISIYSRKSIEELLRGNFPQNAAVISFYDPPGKFRDEEYKPVDYSTKTNCVFQVALHDIDLEVLPKYHLTYETYFQEADDLAEFIFTAKKAGKDIICQCEYGESRSSGCAAAIHEYFYKDGIKIFADYRYYPNQMVKEIKPRKCRYPYNYYPRGRVEITSKNVCIIYMNPNIGEEYMDEIMKKFGLVSVSKIIYDNSSHYRSYLDNGWKADKK